MKNIILLYPADYFDKHTRADDIFEEERIIAQDMGFDIALFDFDDFSLTKKPYTEKSDDNIIIYRGWQLPIDEYEYNLYPLMMTLGKPLTSPNEYHNMHSADQYTDFVSHLMLPYEIISYDKIINDHRTIIEVSKLSPNLFVKDEVKSVYNNNKIELQELIDAIDNRKEYSEILDDIRSRFISIAQNRGDAFSGSFVVKPFIEIVEQARFFIVDHNVVAGIAHDGIWNGMIPDNILLDCPSSFYTIDMGKDIGGNWFIVECGDGQVSDIGEQHYIRDIYNSFNTFR